MDKEEASKEYKVIVTFYKPIVFVKDSPKKKAKKPTVLKESKVSAKIKSFNQYGNLIIEFNEIMKTDYSIESLNSSVCRLTDEEVQPFYNKTNANLTNLMEIYVIPAEDRNLYDRYF